MAYPRPTLKELKDRIVGDIEASTSQKVPLLKYAVLRVLGYVFAGAVYSLYGFIVWVSRQIMPDTAEAEYLEAHAKYWIGARKAAEFASGNIVVTGSNGAALPAGSLFLGLNQIEYMTQANATISGGQAVVTVEAQSSGMTGNLAEGQQLSIISPVAGINNTATVGVGGITGGIDQESDAALRNRIIARIQNPPHGGTAADYVLWALEVAGVTRAWAYERFLGEGTVGVTFVMDDAIGSIIPPQTKIDEVSAYIETKRPLCAQVTVFAPIEQAIDFTIHIVPDNPDIRTEVTSILREFIEENAIPGATIYKSQLDEVVAGANGEIDHLITVPAGNVSVGSTSIGVLGTITWV